MGQQASTDVGGNDSSQRSVPAVSYPQVQAELCTPASPQRAVPNLIATKKIISDKLAATVYSALPAACQSLGRKVEWLQIFSSDVDGKSFQRLVQGISEKGPTVIVIRVKNSTRVIGAFCESDWLPVAAREKLSVSNAAARQRATREGQNTNALQSRPQNQNNVFFGTESCFVFCSGGPGDSSPDENGVVYRSRPSVNSNFMYLFDTHPLEEKIGIGMGGQPGYFGWFIDRWLEHGQCQGLRCTTFQNPRLTETETWEVDAVEAYAVKPDVVQRLLSERGTPQGATGSVLNKNADRNADKMLLELDGVHKFDQNERPEC